MEAVVWAALITGIVSLVVGVYNAIPAIRKSKLDYDTTNIKSISELSKQVNDLIVDKDNLQDKYEKLIEQVDYLRSELRKFRNGYAKALVFINKHVTEKEIPDFLETQELWKGDSK